MLILHTSISSRGLKVFVLLSFLLLTSELKAQTITSTSDGGNWAMDTTWVGGVIPTSIHDVVVASGANVVVRSPYGLGAGAPCNSLTINGTLTMGSGSTTLRQLDVTSFILINSGGVFKNDGQGAHQVNVGGDFTNNGVFIPTLNTGSILLTFNGTGTQVIDSNDLGSIVINKSSGQVEVSSNVVTLGVNSFTLNAGMFVAPASMTISGNMSDNVVGGFQAGSGTITFNGTSQSIGGSVSTSFNNVTGSGNTVITNTRSTTIGGNLTLLNGATFNVGGFDFTVNGTTSVGDGSTGTLVFASTAGTKLFIGKVSIFQNGTWNNSIGDNVTLRSGLSNTGTFTSGGGTYFFTTNSQSVDGIVSLTDVEVGTGVTLTNNGTLTVGTALSGLGSLVQGSDATLNIGGTSFITTLTASGAGNTVNYTGGVQTVKGIPYVNLGLSGTDVSHVKTLTSGASIISGNLSLSGITSTSTVTNLIIGGNLSVSDGATFTMAGDNVTVTGTTTIGLNSTLIFSSTIGIKTFSGLITVNGTWNNSGNETIYIQSGISNTGTFTAGTGVYRFEVNSQTLEGTFSLANMQVVGGITLTLTSGSISISGVLTLNTGNLNIGANILTFDSTASISIAAPSASSMIIVSSGGEVRKIVSAIGSFTFPIGEANGTVEYSPVTVDVTAASAFSSAYIGASVVNEKHTSNASTTNFLTRYWKISQSGITSCEATVTGTYLPADISGTEGEIVASQLSGIFNQVTNGWKKFSAIGSNTLSAVGSILSNGQASVFTGISGTNTTVAITGGDGAAVCAGTGVPLDADVTGEATIVYVWTPATGLSATNVANPTATPATTTIYTLTIYDGNGTSATDNTTVTVTPLPAKPTITASDLLTTSPKLTSSSLTGNQWYKNGGIIAGATSQDLIVSENGSYTVKVTADGCTSLASDAYVIVIVGIENEITRNSRVYPNPANSVIQFDRSGFTNGVEIEVKVYDLMGRLHINTTIEDSETSLDVNNLPKGPHIFVATQSNIMVIQRFVKN